MAKVIKYSSFKRGDTPVFAFTFTSPYDGFDWSATVADFAMTKVAEPNDNTGASVIRIGEPVTDNGDDTATYETQLLVAESNALTPDTEYNVELQLKTGSTDVATVATGVVTVLQDYVI